MSTTIRNKISKKNKYYISKYRTLELRNFCRQYYEWETEYNNLLYLSARSNNEIKSRNSVNCTEDIAIKATELKNRMDIVRSACHESEPEIEKYIFKSLTEGISYTNLRTKSDIPCGADLFYDRWRKALWLIDKKR